MEAEGDRGDHHNYWHANFLACFSLIHEPIFTLFIGFCQRNVRKRWLETVVDVEKVTELVLVSAAQENSPVRSTCDPAKSAKLDQRV
jgi:hypothetical protein